MQINSPPVLTLPNAAVEPVLQKQLTLLLESTGEDIYGIDMKGLCTFINRAGANMIGREPEEVRGCNMHELTHHSHPDGQPYAEHDCAIFSDGWSLLNSPGRFTTTVPIQLTKDP